MKKSIFVILLSAGAYFSADAQKFYTKNGSISFFSKTNMENISAVNNQVMSVLVPQTGTFQFSLLVKGFHFEKALMEEHFNENYIESDKFPKSSFTGLITDLSKVNFSKDGSYPISVSGDLMIHGVTKKTTAPGTIVIKDGVISATSKFGVKLSDFNISVPKLVKDNIKEIQDVTVSCTYDKKM